MIPRPVQFLIDSFSGLNTQVWILALVSLINRAGSMVLPFMSLYLTDALNFSFTQVSIILSSFGFGSIAGNYIGGQLSDRIGTRAVMQWSLILAAVGFTIIPQLTHPWSIATVFFCTALFADAFRPACMSAVGDCVMPEKRSSAIGLIRLAVNLGYAAGPAAAGILIGLIGNHILFYVDAATCFIAMIALISFFKPPAKTTSSESTNQAGSPFTDKRFMLFAISCFLNAVVFMQLFNTLPVFLKTVGGLSEASVGTLMAFNGLLIVFFEMPLLHGLRNISSVAVWIAAGILSVGLGYGLLLMPLSLIIYYAMMFFLTLGEMLSFPLSTTWTLNYAPEASRGKYMGIYGLSFATALVIAPLLGFFLVKQFGWSTMWMIMLFISFLNASYLMLYVRRR